jgi:hypothetical protein
MWAWQTAYQGPPARHSGNPRDHFVVTPQNSGITLFLVLFMSEKYVKY